MQANIVSALQAFEGKDDHLSDELILGLERIMARPYDVRVDIPYAQIAKAEALNQTVSPCLAEIIYGMQLTRSTDQGAFVTSSSSYGFTLPCI